LDILPGDPLLPMRHGTVGAENGFGTQTDDTNKNEERTSHQNLPPTMASTFRRKVNKDTSDQSFVTLKGTKPWTGGITLTSTGLRDLDNLLGSGQPLGTCIWLQEDRWTQSLARCLVKYWCSEVNA